MNLQKISSVLVACIAAGTLFTGCGDDSKNVPKSQIGIITKLNTNEKTFNENTIKLEENVKIPNMNLLHNYHFYPSFQSMMTALDSKQIQEICTYRSVANYLIGKNPNLEILPHSIGMTDSFCLAVRKEDTPLLDALNFALHTLKEEGTIDYIAKSYIFYLNPNDAVPIVEIPKIDGAETLKVGVTGDLPPFDLILDDGTPTGFSARMLVDIGKILNKNIELVKITGGERETALTSKKIDVALWAIVSSENHEKAGSIAKNIDVPDTLAVTSPYYEDEIVHIGLKK